MDTYRVTHQIDRGMQLRGYSPYHPGNKMTMAKMGDRMSTYVIRNIAHTLENINKTNVYLRTFCQALLSCPDSLAEF